MNKMEKMIMELSQNVRQCKTCKSMIPLDRAIVKDVDLELSPSMTGIVNVGEGDLKVLKIKQYNCPCCNSWLDSVLTNNKGEKIKTPIVENNISEKEEMELGLKTNNNPGVNIFGNPEDVRRLQSIINTTPCKSSMNDFINYINIGQFFESLNDARETPIGTDLSTNEDSTVPRLSVGTITPNLKSRMDKDSGKEKKNSSPDWDEKAKHIKDIVSKKSKKGFVIVIEGTDGSGKNTQAKLLLEKLIKMGVKASMYSFPNYKSIQGKLIDKYLKGGFKDQTYLNHRTIRDNVQRIAMLYSTDRMVTCMEKDSEGKSIIDRYNDGEVIIFDRYTQSNFIHQGANFKDRIELEDFMINMEYVEYELMGLPKPDMVLYLKVDMETSLKNIEKRGRDKDIHETEEHLKSVYDHVDRVIGMRGWDCIRCTDGIASADTGRSVTYMRPMSHIHSEIMEYVEPRLRNEGFLNHINYCPNAECSELNVVLKSLKIKNNSEYNIGVCPVCDNIYDLSKLKK